MKASGLCFDAVVRIPSSGDDAVPYYEAILSTLGPVLDLTGNANRKFQKRAAGNTTLDE